MCDCKYKHRLTWLKKHLKELGLQRRGPGVIYTPLSMVKEAMKVSSL